MSRNKRKPHSCLPIWEQLKAKGTLTVVVMPGMVEIVKKEVINEKYLDLAYKLECGLDGVTKKLRIDVTGDDGNVVTFSLLNRGEVPSEDEILARL